MGTSSDGFRDLAVATDTPENWAAATAATLPQLRDALVRALGSGVLAVSAGGVSKTYRSVADLQAAIRAIDYQLEAIGEAQPKARFIRINAARGW